MQQLTYALLMQHSRWHMSAIHIDLPLPDIDDIAQWAAHIAALFATSYRLDVGADRAQIFFQLHQQDCVLNLEWLCESIWLESLSGRVNNQTGESATYALWLAMCENTDVKAAQ